MLDELIPVKPFEGKQGTGKLRNVNTELSRDSLEMGAVAFAKLWSYCAHNQLS